MQAPMRKYTAATLDKRCRQDIRLTDGSGAQCMRAAVKDGLCLQHHAMGLRTLVVVPAKPTQA